AGHRGYECFRDADQRGSRNAERGTGRSCFCSAFRLPRSAFFRAVTSVPPEISAFVAFLEKERNDSPHTVKAYERDVKDFAAFCGRYYGGSWGWAGVARLAMRGWLGALQQRGLAKRSAARALSALRTFYRFLAATQGLEVNPAKAARTPKV